MASLDDYRKQQIMDRAGVKPLVSGLMQQAQSPEMFSAKMPPLATKAATTPAASRPLAAAVGQKPITMPAGSAGWEAELTRMNNPGADVREPGQGSFWGGVKNALMYNSDVAAQQSRATQSAAKPPVSQDTSNYSNEGRNYRSPIVTSDASTQASQAQAPSNPLVSQIAPGIYRQGNSYGDSPQAAAEFASNKPVSAQNMAAADALAARYQSNPIGQTPVGFGGAQNWTSRDNAIMAANIRDGVDPYRGTSVSPGPIALVINDTSGGNGMSWEEANRERSLRMAAERLTPGAKTALKAFYESMRMRQEGMSKEREANADRSFRAGEGAKDRLMRGQELNSRMGESAADRALRGEELADNRLTSAARREALGIETGAAKQLADLRTAYMNAKTPEEQSAVAKKLQELSGKAPAADWGVQVTPGVKNIDGSTTEGSVYRFNKATGEVQRVDGQQKQATEAAPTDAAQRKAGTTYMLPNGKMGQWTPQGWLLVG